MKCMILAATVVGLATTSLFGSVVSGPVTFNDHEYYVISSQAWATADAEAAALGGHLVAISDQAEQDFVFGFIGGGSHWIGLTDQAAEGVWLWTSGDPVTYTNWNLPWEPNGSGGENCGALEVAWGGKWNDLPCSRIHPAIVEVGPSLPDDLVLWLRGDRGVEVVAGAVPSWEDQSGYGHHAVQGDANLQPEYVASNPDVAGQPTLRFDHDSLHFDGSYVGGSDYTVFVVNGRNRFGLANFYLAGSTAGTNRNLVLGYERPDLIRQAHYGNDLDAEVEPYTGAPIWALDVFRFSQDEGRAIYRWGTKVASDSDTEPVTDWAGATIGQFSALPYFWFHGDLAEIIIYTRAVECPERVAMASDLAAKYGLPYEPELCDDVDSDDDGIDDVDDNCPADSNPGQSDNDLDGAGDVCDADDDNDTVLDEDDNCQFTANLDQTDLDMDGLGDSCDADVDGDGVCDDPAVQLGCAGGPDNCPANPNAFQTDTDMDGAGDECDADDDNDGVCDIGEDAVDCAAGPDNCPTTVNPGQADQPDGDGIGDICDADDDNDGTDDVDDNCPVTANAGQNDTDMDGAGDACDTDDDNDGVLDVDDNCQFVPNASQNDADGDGTGDACNDANDRDGDEWSDALDNCPDAPNSDQNDLDGDGQGDSCDPDIDGDGVDNGPDLCAGTPLGELVNPANGCSIEQLCPCDGPRGTNVSWKNHGKYVSCVAHGTKDFVAAGLITEEEKGAMVSAAGQSDCGKK